MISYNERRLWFPEGFQGVFKGFSKEVCKGVSKELLRSFYGRFLRKISKEVYDGFKWEVSNGFPGNSKGISNGVYKTGFQVGFQEDSRGSPKYFPGGFQKILGSKMFSRGFFGGFR